MQPENQQLPNVLLNNVTSNTAGQQAGAPDTTTVLVPSEGSGASPSLVVGTKDSTRSL
jgi:hypothetical protein